MVSVGPENDNDDPEVDVNAMIAKVGAESVATVQVPNLRRRAQRHAARLARQNASGGQPASPLHQQLSGVSDDGSDSVSSSDSDGASVGAPTRARHVNDRSAPAFDMHAFAQVLSQYTSQHVPAVNVTGGKAAAIAKSDKCCDTRQCRCSYQCTGYGLVHGRLAICLRVLSRIRNIL